MPIFPRAYSAPNPNQVLPTALRVELSVGNTAPALMERPSGFVICAAAGVTTTPRANMPTAAMRIFRLISILLDVFGRRPAGAHASPTKDSDGCKGESASAFVGCRLERACAAGSARQARGGYIA